MSWYDAHGGDDGGDGTISVKEFGWCLADCAECDSIKMIETLARFEATVDVVQSRQAESG